MSSCDDEAVVFEGRAQHPHHHVVADRGRDLAEVFKRRKFSRATKPRLHKLGNFREGRVAHHHGMKFLAAAMQHEVEEGHEVAFENLFP
jgi:hypothetical protein